MRIQILNLPSIVVGDDVKEPFALIVDQYDGHVPDEGHAEAWKGFRDSCGAAAILVTPDTVEVVAAVDLHADCDPVAVREFGRLDDFLLMNFDDEPGVRDDNDSAADVAIRLLNQELLRRDAAKAANQTVRLLGEIRNQCIGQDRCAGDNCPAHRETP